MEARSEAAHLEAVLEDVLVLWMHSRQVGLDSLLSMPTPHDIFLIIYLFIREESLLSGVPHSALGIRDDRGTRTPGKK